MTKSREFPERLSWLSPGRKRPPVVLGTTEFDCAAACLAMALGLHGRRVELRAVRELLGGRSAGVSARTLAEVARQLGLACRGVRLRDAAELKFLPAGSIIHWGFRHFVVLERCSRGGALIVDPAVGRRRVSWELLAVMVTGVALEIRGSAKLPSSPRRKAFSSPGLRLIAASVWQSRGKFFGMFALSLVTRAMALALPFVVKFLVDGLMRGEAVLSPAAAFAWAGGGLLFVYALSLWGAFMAADFRAEVGFRTSWMAFERALRLPLREHELRSATDVGMRVSSLGALRESLIGAVMSLPISLLTMLGALAVSFSLSVKLTLIAVLPLVALGGASYVARERYRALQSEILAASAVSGTFQVEVFEGIESIKTSTAEGAVSAAGAGFMAEQVNASRRAARLRAAVDALFAAHGVAIPFLILTTGIAEVLAGHLSLGTVLAMGSLVLMFQRPALGLLGGLLNIQGLRSLLARVDDLLADGEESTDHSLSHARSPRVEIAQAVTPRRDPQDSGERVARFHGDRSRRAQGAELEVERLGFRYSPQSPFIVRDLTLDVAAGESVALVGPSGAGKTTLVRLLAGVLDAEEGEIRFDGHPLAAARATEAIRRQISVVSQGSRLFRLSIMANLTLGNAGAEFTTLEQLCRRLGIDDFVSHLPMAYETVVTPQNFSGGQRQLLLLARALLRSPRLLILDEATSELDSNMEARLFDLTREIGCTQLLVGHRSSSLGRVDRVLAIEALRVEESPRVARTGA